MKIQLGWFLSLLAGVAFAGAALAQSQPQPAQQTQQGTDSVADAARKAKTDKPKNAPKKVYTDDDLSSLHGGGVSVVGDKDSGTADKDAAGAKTGGDAGAKPAKGEAWWRDRAQKLRDQMAQVDSEIDKVQDEVKKGGGAGFNVQSGLTSNTVYFEDRNTKLKNLQKKKAEIQKQMDALEEEARQADVPLSWIR
jgi:hypothetical protein